METKKRKASPKKKKSKEPAMSDKEAILVYKLSVAEGKLHELQQEVRSCKEKNERHVKRNQKLLSEQGVLMERVLEYAKESEEKWRQEEVVNKDVVTEALRDKWHRVKDQKKYLDDMKKEILSTDQEIEDIDKQIEYWKEYETKGQIEDRKEIDKLQKQIKDQHECFDYLQTAWEDRLTNEKSSITDVMTRKLESQKSKATEKVACLMPKHCYLQMKDNDWLRSEIEYRLKEYEERSKSVSELERTNLEIMKRLFELGANDLRLSKDDILNECSEHDDIVTSPSETEIDLSKFIDKLSKEIDVNLDRTVAVYSRPPTSFFLTQDEDSEYLSLGPLDWKLLSVHGRRAPLHDSGPMSEEELFALDDHREEWPVTQQMLNSLKLNK